MRIFIPYIDQNEHIPDNLHGLDQSIFYEKNNLCRKSMDFFTFLSDEISSE